MHDQARLLALLAQYGRFLCICDYFGAQDIGNWRGIPYRGRPLLQTGKKRESLHSIVFRRIDLSRSPLPLPLSSGSSRSHPAPQLMLCGACAFCLTPRMPARSVPWSFSVELQEECIQAREAVYMHAFKARSSRIQPYSVQVSCQTHARPSIQSSCSCLQLSTLRTGRTSSACIDGRRCSIRSSSRALGLLRCGQPTYPEPLCMLACLVHAPALHDIPAFRI